MELHVFPIPIPPPTTPVFLPEELHGQRSLVGYIPWGRKESDMTEGFSLSLVSLIAFSVTYLCRVEYTSEC